MSDGNSITGSLKDLAKETVKQVVSTPLSIAKGVPGQIVGTDSEEEQARKKAEKMAVHMRIKEIEAEMAQIRSAETRNRQAQSPAATQPSVEELHTKKEQKVDEASRQAVGKAEQGRNFKG